MLFSKANPIYAKIALMFGFSKKKDNLRMKATVNGKSLPAFALKDFWKYIQLHKAYPIDVQLLEVHYVDSCIFCLHL
jgi:hypothetical protein